MLSRILKLIAICALPILCASNAFGEKLVLLAGNSVHMWGDHENKAMCLLFKDLLAQACPSLEVEIVDDVSKCLSDANPPSAILIIGEGESNHPLKDNPEILDKLREKKINIGAIHYALHFSNSRDYKFLDKAVGGHYEPYWSTNPAWTAEFKLSDHPIANGVKPFTIHDEFYFNIRFSNQPEQKISHIAKAVPPDSLRMRQFGMHTGNPYIRVNKGKAETLLWAVENPDGTRGIGFGGGHSIWAMGHKDFRKLLINAAAWLAKIEIPVEGFGTSQPDFDLIAASIKDKPKRPDQDSFIEMWRKFFKENADSAK